MTFEWDDASDADGNVAHIARHGVTPAEAEEVVRHPRATEERSASSTYPIRFAPTKTGKYLAVVFSAVGTNPEVVRVVTAYPVPRPRR